MTSKVYGFAVTNGAGNQTLSMHATVGGAFSAAQTYVAFRVQGIREQIARATNEDDRVNLRVMISNLESDAESASYANGWQGMDNIHGQKCWRFLGNAAFLEFLVTEYEVKE